MRLDKCMKTTKCDIYGCENTAEYCICTKGVIKREFAVCSDCLKQMYSQIGRLQVPRATQSPFKLKPRLRKENYEKNS